MAIMIAIGFSAFDPYKGTDYLTFSPNLINSSNVVSPLSYNTSFVYCDSGCMVPCRVNIYPYETEAEFIDFLETLTMPEDRINEVLLRAEGNFKDVGSNTVQFDK